MGNTWNKTRLKTLCVMRYFVLHTDKEHPANAKQIIAHLATLGISAERKSIYADIAILREFGLRIDRHDHSYYYVPQKGDFMEETKSKLYR